MLALYGSACKREKRNGGGGSTVPISIKKIENPGGKEQ